MYNFRFVPVSLCQCYPLQFDSIDADDNAKRQLFSGCCSQHKVTHTGQQ